MHSINLCTGTKIAIKIVTDSNSTNSNVAVNYAIQIARLVQLGG